MQGLSQQKATIIQMKRAAVGDGPVSRPGPGATRCPTAESAKPGCPGDRPSENYIFYVKL